MFETCERNLNYRLLFVQCDDRAASECPDDASDRSGRRSDAGRSGDDQRATQCSQSAEGGKDSFHSFTHVPLLCVALSVMSFVDLYAPIKCRQLILYSLTD